MHYFVTYSNYQIDLTAPAITFGIIFAIIFILIGITCKRNSNSFFDTQTTASLRGVGVLCLLFGHLSIKCLKQEMFFTLGGYWAVIIFLFISGYGLYQKYQLNNIRGSFWEKRISRLYPPLWITLVLFICLDYFLINLRHPLQEILLNVLGIYKTDMLIRINAVAWFVTYIMVQYLAYWLISKLPLSDIVKLICLFIMCFSIAILVYLSPRKNNHSMGLQYTILFPVGVLFGKYQKQIITLITKHLRNQINLFKPLFISLVIFYFWPENILNIIRPLALIIPIIFILIIYKRINLQSTFLIFLGNYSYEIYLLHGPFMVKYDFFLFREPLYIFFFVYFASLLILSRILSQASILIKNNFLMLSVENIKNKFSGEKSRTPDLNVRQAQVDKFF